MAGLFCSLLARSYKLRRGLSETHRACSQPTPHGIVRLLDEDGVGGGALACRNVPSDYSSPLSLKSPAPLPKRNISQGHEASRSRPLDGGCSWHGRGARSWLSLLSHVFKEPALVGAGARRVWGFARPRYTQIAADKMSFISHFPGNREKILLVARF